MSEMNDDGSQSVNTATEIVSVSNDQQQEAIEAAIVPSTTESAEALTPTTTPTPTPDNNNNDNNSNSSSKPSTPSAQNTNSGSGRKGFFASLSPNRQKKNKTVLIAANKIETPLESTTIKADDAKQSAEADLARSTQGGSSSSTRVPLQSPTGLRTEEIIAMHVTQQAEKQAAQSGGGSTSNAPFVNQGLLAWEQSRERWLGGFKHGNNGTSGSESDTKAVATPLEVDEIIDVIFASPRQVREQGGPRKFPNNVPLPQMVDILQDLWEAEGLDI